jgi:hypothetical protein
MIYLRQSTASQEIPLGYFVDSTDGNTEETGLTIANTDIKLWKAGATTLANKNSGGATHISNGLYYAVLDATDTDTIGPLVVFVHVSGALAVKVNCVVLDEAIYDQMFGTTAFATSAAVASAVMTSLNTDTFAEPGQGAPAATTTLVAKIGYLYKNWRNRKAQTATEFRLYNDDATTVDQKATVADDGTTASKTEIATGP